MGTRERRERSNESDRLLASLFTNVPGLALAAVGGYGRGELSPGSDLDLLFLHNGRIDEATLSELVSKILYPLWDKSFKVDHSVRTRGQTRESAAQDLRTALGLLDIRFICGEADLVASVRNDVIDDWRRNSHNRLPELKLSLSQRHMRSGELAYLLEPDLKEARGGLRDITALRAIALSGATPVALEHIGEAESILMNVRETLHIITGKDKDRLLFHEQDKVAELLSFSDADELMGTVAQAARAVDYLLETTWHSFNHRAKNGLGRFLKKPITTALAPGISVVGQEVIINESFEIANDPVIGIRTAAFAAQAGLPIAPTTMKRLKSFYDQGLGLLPNPWPRSARESLIQLIGAGQPMVQIWEGLDQEEIIFAWLPEWRAVRSLPQRNALHRHTVDRHQVETAVFAAALTRKVHRPDILLFAALFHDIGKGTQADHSERGELLIEPLARRIGFSDDDVTTLKILIRHHLLLSATSTRRDLNDPATISSVLSLIPDLQTLELLHALSIADGQATGNAAWSQWKESLLKDLVTKVTGALTDNTIAVAPEFSDEQLSFAQTGRLRVILESRDPDFAIEIIAPDKPGLLSIVSGVLNLARFDVRSARTQTVGQSAIMKWIVTPNQYAPTVDQNLLQQMISEAMLDPVKLEAKIHQRIADYARLPKIPVPSPIVETFMDAATDATIIEVRSHDRPALLFAIGDEVTKCEIDIRSAIVTTLGAEAIDTLYVTEIGGGSLSPERAATVAQRLTGALA
ncbi:MAG: [protein-PII] uridylyltransferase [Candidatus Planktophila sp.]